MNSEQLRNLTRGLIKSCTIRIGNIDDKDYQSITHKPCRICKKMTVVEDIAKGYSTLKDIDVCPECKWRYVQNYSKRQPVF